MNNKNLKKNIFWRIRNSLWQLWDFLPYLGFISFIWIGRRAQKALFWCYGMLYFIFGFAVPFSFMIMNGKENSFLMTTVLLFWISGIVLSFLWRDEYLKRRESYVYYREHSYHFQEDFKNALEHQKRANDNLEIKKPQVEEKVVEEIEQLNLKKDDNQEVINMEQIDLNTCTENEYLKLPGVGALKGKKAVSHRQDYGGFVSVDEFCQLLSLPNHFVIQIKNQAFVFPLNNTKEEKSRNLDF